MPLDPTSISILRLMIDSGGEISAQLVLDIIENPSLSEGHKLKLRIQIIENLNLKLRALLNLERDIIQEVRSSTNRRNKIYKLDVSLFKSQP